MAARPSPARSVGSLAGVAGPVVACASCGTRNRVPAGAGGRPRCASCHADLPWIVEAGDGDFDEAVRTDRLVLVDLWAEWCGPCRMVAPILERLAADLAGRLKVVKVDVDAAPAIARRYDVRSIPTLLYVRDGAVVDTVIGAQSEHVLRSVVERHL